MPSQRKTMEWVTDPSESMSCSLRVTTPLVPPEGSRPFVPDGLLRVVVTVSEKALPDLNYFHVTLSLRQRLGARGESTDLSVRLGPQSQLTATIRREVVCSPMSVVFVLDCRTQYNVLPQGTCGVAIRARPSTSVRNGPFYGIVLEIHSRDQDELLRHVAPEKVWFGVASKPTLQVAMSSCYDGSPDSPNTGDDREVLVRRLCGCTCPEEGSHREPSRHVLSQERLCRDISALFCEQIQALRLPMDRRRALDTFSAVLDRAAQRMECYCGSLQQSSFAEAISQAFSELRT